MPGNYKKSKEARKEVYDYVEILLGRKLEQNEAIKLSQLVRESIHVQSEHIVYQNKLLERRIITIRKKADHKIEMLLNTTQYVINQQGCESKLPGEGS